MTAGFAKRFLKGEGAAITLENTEDVYDRFLKKIYDCPQGLDENDRLEIEKKLNEIEAVLYSVVRTKTELGRLIDYDHLRKNGFSSPQIECFIKEDDQTIKDAEAFLQTSRALGKRMFGYPVRYDEDTAIVKYLRYLEGMLPLINNCGDTYEVSNFAMNSKVAYEQPILEKMYKHVGLKLPVIKDGEYIGPWGYITSGGSESNKWGILNGLRKYPNATVYYSKAAHYSVPKSVKMNIRENGKEEVVKYVDYEIISTKNNSEKIDVAELIGKIENNWRLHKKPAVILLTWGTTKTGARDDVEEISNELKKLNVAHYIHLDAALYGGVPNNQENAPILPDMEKSGIDSVSVSLHKYIGNAVVNSVVIAKSKPVCEYVDYIGITDSTISGSRSFNTFSMLQRVKETFERKSAEEYQKNIAFFENLLKEKKVDYLREEQANIFIINKPSDQICKKFQLSVFNDNNGIQKAHIIIFDNHQENMMRELADEIASDKNCLKKS